MNTDEILQLIAEVKASRNAVTRDASLLIEELNFVDKASVAIRRKPLAWLSGATLGGLLFSRFAFGKNNNKLGKRKMGGEKFDKEHQKRGVEKLTLWSFLLGTLRLALPLLKPLLSAYASKRLSEMALSLSQK